MDKQTLFRVLYLEQGKREQAWRSTFEAARRAADEVIEATLTGAASALKLSAADRHAYLRAVEFLVPLNIPPRPCRPRICGNAHDAGGQSDTNRSVPRMKTARLACDLAIIGGGLSGVRAAITAARLQ
jgi:NADPH-dependent 2,4-dienoyl-CoA reductase/sulfur reductase-like enzyme